MKVGYYVHHHGAGHRVRATVLQRALVRRDHEVTLLGSDGRLRDVGAACVMLPRDDDESPLDPTAGDFFHWAPRHHRGHQQRLTDIATWITTTRPDVVVVDVSAEVALLCRLLGVPVCLVAQPGDRSDDVHARAFAVASAIIAPWPQESSPCIGLETVHEKVHPVGGLSRFAPGSRERNGPRDGPAVVLGGADSGSVGLHAYLEGLQPRWDWVHLGRGSWHDDPSAVLRRAPVVVAHAGQNAVADVAACGAPLVVAASPRPFDEQEHQARELQRLALAVASPGIGAAEQEWEAAIDAAQQLDVDWGRWHTDGAADRACRVVETAAGLE